MPHGFFTIEQWKLGRRGGRSRWVVVAHLDGSRRLFDALATLESRGKPGFYRVVQTQRMIWAERPGGGGRLKLRKWHASTPELLARTARAFERDGGKWPLR